MNWKVISNTDVSSKKQQGRQKQLTH